MSSEVTAQAVLARSLVDCEAYWNALGTLTKAEERRREHECEVRTICAAQGCDVPAPDDPMIADIRSGKKERRDKRSMQALLRDQAKLAKWKREGYSFDAEHRLVTPPRIHAPERRETGEKRPATRRRTGARASPEEPSPESDPPLRVIPPSAFRAEVSRLLGGAT